MWIKYVMYRMMGCVFCPKEHDEAIVKCNICCQTKKMGCSTTIVKARNATNILNEVDAGSWWVGRVHAMWRHNGKKFGLLRPLGGHFIVKLNTTCGHKRIYF